MGGAAPLHHLHLLSGAPAEADKCSVTVALGLAKRWPSVWNNLETQQLSQCVATSVTQKMCAFFFSLFFFFFFFGG